MTEHHAALAWGDVPDMLERVRASNATDAVKGAIEMVALSAARSGEVRGMMWREVDWDASMWTVPAPRTKGGKADFRVALSMQAKDLLHRFTREYKPDDLVFSGSRGRVLHDGTLSDRLRDLGIPGTIHGLRSSFRDWCATQTDAPFEVCEAALSHSIGGATVRAYARTDFLELRRPLMQQWADVVVPTEVPF